MAFTLAMVDDDAAMRSRVMRDMHVGLGAQLSGLLSLAGQADTPRQALQDDVRGAIAALR